MEPLVADERPCCPFCPYSVSSGEELCMLELMQHLEYCHPENDGSPFMVRERSRSRSTARIFKSGSGRGRRSSSQPSPRRRSLSQEGTDHKMEVSSLNSALLSDENLRNSICSLDCFVECPLEDCVEIIHTSELDQHLDLHDYEHWGQDETHHIGVGRRSISPRQRSSTELPFVPQPSSSGPDRILDTPFRTDSRVMQDSSRIRWSSAHPLRNIKEKFRGSAPKRIRLSQTSQSQGALERLGREELGPYAFEEKMPSRLRRKLQHPPKIVVHQQVSPTGVIVQTKRIENEVPGVIAEISRLCEIDSSLSKVFLCHPSVKHIFKLPKEGGFCGYRNIQMLISFLQETQFPGAELFPGNIPSIFKLQDLIEKAWDEGYDAPARAQTGGIKGTRKYIGTPEAQALFSSLGIPCEASAYSQPVTQSSNRDFVHDAILQVVFQYFSTDVKNPSQKVYQTGLPPIYLQHPGHSMTIVGLEVRKSGHMNLLVFDPMFKTPPPVLHLMASANVPAAPSRMLRPFRRGDAYLSQYNSFEILRFTAPHPIQPDIGRLRVDEPPSTPTRKGRKTPH